MLSLIKSFVMYSRINVLLYLFFYLIFLLIFGFFLNNHILVSERYNEILLGVFVFFPFISSFVVVPTVYDIYISDKKEILFGVRNKLLFFLFLNETIFMTSEVIFFEFVRYSIYKKVGVLVLYDYTTRFLLTIVSFQIISFLFCLLMKNKIAVYGSLIIYVIISVFLFQYGGVLIFKGYLFGTELGADFISFFVNQFWKIIGLIIVLIILKKNIIYVRRS